MAWLPGAIVKSVDRFNPGGSKASLMDRHDAVVNHIAVSDGASLFNYFNQSGNPCSHFYVRKSGNTNGMADFEQYVDTRYRAPAQLEGNHRCISIETQGGVGSDLDNPWTATQVNRLAWILKQCSDLHGIPLQLMPNSLSTSRGLGYHRLGVNPWRVSGGELWSEAYGKVCPGSARVAQQPQILSLAKQGDEVVTPEEIEAIAAKVWAWKVGPTGPAQQSVGNIMFRLDPGATGLGPYVAAQVWDEETTNTRDGSVIKTLDLLRYAHGDSGRAAETLAEGGPINAQLDAIQSTLVDEDMQTDEIATAVTTPLSAETIAGIASAVAAVIPPGEPVTQEALEGALRNVLGSLNDPATP
jgi:N-acetylmuramoyl-L-alanine amidase